MQTLDFVSPTRNSERIFLRTFWTALHETEGLQEIFQNQRAFYFYMVDLFGKRHLEMRNFLICEVRYHIGKKFGYIQCGFHRPRASKQSPFQ